MQADPAQIEVEQLAETARLLPPLPQTTSQIIAILADPLFEVGELIKVVALDQKLTANLLRICNSALYGRSRPADSVGEAVVCLGSDIILALALAGTARPSAKYDLKSFGLTVSEYWRHCVGSVAAAEELQSRRIASFGSGFSSAALLHDFGKLVLSKHITPLQVERMAEFLQHCPGQQAIDAERAVLGVDHAVAGAVVARQWNLSQNVVAAIEDHHGPVNWERDLTNGVILANQIARENSGQTDFGFDVAQNVADAMFALGMDDGTYDSVLAASQVRFLNLIDLFSV